MREGQPSTQLLGCILRHVATRTAARTNAGMTAHVKSMGRKLSDARPFFNHAHHPSAIDPRALAYCLMRQSATIDPPSTLPRRLGLWSAVAVVIGTTIGSGIFRSPASITNRLPGPLPLLSVWVIGGALALCGALTLAEIAGAFPHTGGVYVFVREGWGRLPAFLFGW